MCGISGFISHRRITEDELRTMNNSMYHRGPDDEGVEIYDGIDGYSVGFAQRRLSIIDLSPLGHQPMHSVDKGLSIVFNGEIYNYLELKRELKSKGYEFTSDSDTEVILSSYLEWGIDCLDRLNGMFAFAIYDRGEKCVYIARDRIGKKPLYYEIEKTQDGENLYFASELKPIMLRPGFERRLNRSVMSEYLVQQYINAPYTVFENVAKLEPGTVLCFDLLGRQRMHSKDGFEARSDYFSTKKYWDISSVYKKMQENPISDYDEAKRELKNLLTESVRKRMIADVPLGTFLSGGYDSTLVTAIAQSISDEKVKTFSVGFSDERYNEADFARRVSEYLGTDHTDIIMSEDDMFSQLEDISRYYDEPFADPSELCTMLVSKLAREKVTVALSGDGGDEFFCGYNIYDKVRMAQKLDGLGALTYGFCNLPGLKGAGIFEHLPFKIRAIAGNRNPELKTQFASGNYPKIATEMSLGEQLGSYFAIESRYDTDNWQIKRMLLDMDTYLPGDILCKVDRASMKYSLENRCPILDKDVMEYSFRMSHEIKYWKGEKKRILKDLTHDYVPREIMDRPKKGFSIPLDKWLRGPLREELLTMSDIASLKKQDVFNAEYTSNFIRHYLEHEDGGPDSGANYSNLAWAFFVFNKWYEKYIDK